MNELSGIRFGAEITSAAQASGLDPRLLAAVAAQETGGPGSSSGNNVVGDGGHGHGLFQIDDRSWAFARTPGAMDPAQSATAAAHILAANLKQYGGNVRAALSAYNTGSPTATGTTTRWADGATLGYADSVLRHVSELGGRTGTFAAEAPSTSADVNALAALSASGAYDSNAGLDPASLCGTSSSQSQFSPVRAWTSMTSGQSGSAGAAAGNEADSGPAAILDQGNVFDDGASA